MGLATPTLRISMTSGDWRSEGAYAHLRDTNWRDYAWEYLRRNDDYQAQYADPEFRARLDAGVDGPERCWGLRFRG